MKVLKVGFNSNEFELSMKGPKGNERLKIVSGVPDNQLSKQLFSQLGLMHLIAPYFPKKISTDFNVSKEIKKLIGAMYKSEDHNPPVFQMPKEESTGFTSLNTDPNKVAVAYSAGKDSLWNMYWAQKDYGNKNVLGVHIGGLNRGVGATEKEYTKRQVKELDFKNFQFIDLLNSSKNGGHGTMRSRDMFLAGVIISNSVEFGASKIITEGFEEENPTEPFSGKEKNMQFFNRILEQMGIPVEVAWRNKKEMDIIKDLLLNKPDWLTHVHNCFSAPCYKIALKKSWQHRAPSFPLYDSQCGSCVKCRITNVARILYDSTMKSVKVEDIKTYLKNTVSWVKDRYEDLADFIDGSFTRDLKKALEKYEIS